MMKTNIKICLALTVITVLISCKPRNNTAENLADNMQNNFPTKKARLEWWVTQKDSWKAAFNRHYFFHNTASANKKPSDKNIMYLMNLKKLSIGEIHSKNLLKDFTGINHLKNLSSVSLTMQDINDFTSLDTLTNIESLNLYFGNISSLQGINKLTKLKKLNLSKNRLNSLDGI